MMAERYLLQIDSQLCTLLHWHEKKLWEQAQFANDEHGLAQFREFLQTRNPKLQHHFSLLLDIVDESYLIETVPFVRGHTRRTLLQRKLQQYFQSSNLCTVRSLGRLGNPRRDEQLLLAGLTRNRAFEPWLEQLRQARYPVEGIYSAASAVEILIQKCFKQQAQVLVMTLGRAGIRLSYFEQGQLRLSHLTSALPSDQEHLALLCQQEALRLHQYLQGQHRLTRASVLPCLVLADTELRSHLYELSPRSPLLSFDIEYLDDIYHKLHLQPRTHANPDTPISPCLAIARLSDEVLAHLTLSQRADLQFADPEERKLYRQWQQRRVLTLASRAALLALWVIIALQWWSIYEQGQQTLKQESKRKSLEQDYQRRLAARTPEQIQPESLKALYLAYRHLEEHAPSPADSLYALSTTLDAFPSVTLHTLEWQLGQEENRHTGPNSPPVVSQGQQSVDLTLSASLPKHLSPRQQWELTQNLAYTLGYGPKRKVTVLQKPVNLSSDTPLSPDSPSLGTGELKLRLTALP